MDKFTINVGDEPITIYVHDASVELHTRYGLSELSHNEFENWCDLYGVDYNSICDVLEYQRDGHAEYEDRCTSYKYQDTYGNCIIHNEVKKLKLSKSELYYQELMDLMGDVYSRNDIIDIMNLLEIDRERVDEEDIAVVKEWLKADVLLDGWEFINDGWYIRQGSGPKWGRIREVFLAGKGNDFARYVSECVELRYNIERLAARSSNVEELLTDLFVFDDIHRTAPDDIRSALLMTEDVIAKTSLRGKEWDDALEIYDWNYEKLFDDLYRDPKMVEDTVRFSINYHNAWSEFTYRLNKEDGILMEKLLRTSRNPLDVLCDLDWMAEVGVDCDQIRIAYTIVCGRDYSEFRRRFAERDKSMFRYVKVYHKFYDGYFTKNMDLHGETETTITEVSSTRVMDFSEDKEDPFA